MNMSVQHVLRPLPYEGARAFEPHLRCIYPLENGKPKDRAVGGVIAKNGRYLAYVSKMWAINLCQDRTSLVVLKADHYAWGNSASEALAKIKPHLPA